MDHEQQHAFIFAQVKDKCKASKSMNKMTCIPSEEFLFKPEGKSADPFETLCNGFPDKTT